MTDLGHESKVVDMYTRLPLLLLLLLVLVIVIIIFMLEHFKALSYILLFISRS